MNTKFVDAHSFGSHTYCFDMLLPGLCVNIIFEKTLEVGCPRYLASLYCNLCGLCCS